MEFEKEWLEIAKRFMGYFEKMVEMEEKRWELMSKPIESISITPTDIIPIDKMATPNTIKRWYDKLQEDCYSYIEGIDDEYSNHIKNIISEIGIEMKKYIDEI